jgi:hypothetical protein
VPGISKTIFALPHFKKRLESLESQIFSTIIRLAIQPVGDNPPPQSGQNILDNGVVQTHDRESVKRNLVGKGHKGIHQRFHTPVMLEMLWIDIGHNGNCWVQMEEATVGFIRFGDNPIPLP